MLRIFGPKRGEVTGSWRELHNKGAPNLYSSPNIIRIIKYRRMSSVGHLAYVGEIINVYELLIGKPEVKRSLRRPRDRWEDDNMIELVVKACQGQVQQGPSN
jgi:hypothetical protein